MQRTRGAAKKALEIDDTVAEAHSMLGTVLWMHDWDWAGAEPELKRAIELSPSFADAAENYAWYLALMGRRDESLREAKRALELDPVSVNAYRAVAATYFWARQYDQSIEYIRKWIEIYPSSQEAYDWLKNVYWEKGMYDEAVAAFQKAATLDGASPKDIALWVHLYKVGRVRGVYRRLLAGALSARQVERSCGIASLYARLGEKDRAFEWLEKAYKEREVEMVFLRVSPNMDPIRSDPRFQDLLRRMNFPP
ncbi:MAG: tetratricopeptide repeat protein [Acidobacteriia bacterium]|nr:tetratricopeptide repeat protein [Terriglobia bacterium]